MNSHSSRVCLPLFLVFAASLGGLGCNTASDDGGSSSNDEVVAGKRGTIADLPWVAPLMNTAEGKIPVNNGWWDDKTKASGQWCTAVVVDATHVLTAAHCILSADKKHDLVVKD